MGTRHCSWLRHDGQDIVGQYGQWDGYYSGQGVNVIAFIYYLMTKEGMKKRFEQNILLINQVTDAEVQAMLVDCGADPNSEWIDMETSRLFGERYPTMHRDTGTDIFWYILSASPTGKQIPVRVMHEDPDADTWIEYSYRIDLDTETLYVYRGFGGEPAFVFTFKHIVDRMHELAKSWNLELNGLPSIEDLEANGFELPGSSAWFKVTAAFIRDMDSRDHIKYEMADGDIDSSLNVDTLVQMMAVKFRIEDEDRSEMDRTVDKTILDGMLAATGDQRKLYEEALEEQ